MLRYLEESPVAGYHMHGLEELYDAYKNIGFVLPGSLVFCDKLPIDLYFSIQLKALQRN